MWHELLIQHADGSNSHMIYYNKLRTHVENDHVYIQVCELVSECDED